MPAAPWRPPWRPATPNCTARPCGRSGNWHCTNTTTCPPAPTSARRKARPSASRSRSWRKSPGRRHRPCAWPPGPASSRKTRWHWPCSPCWSLTIRRQPPSSTAPPPRRPWPGATTTAAPGCTCRPAPPAPPPGRPRRCTSTPCAPCNQATRWPPPWRWPKPKSAPGPATPRCSPCWSTWPGLRASRTWRKNTCANCCGSPCLASGRNRSI